VFCGDTDGALDNDFSDFVRPEHYIRHIGKFGFWESYLSFNSYQVTAEPLESDLARQVEYDMDEQGQLL
jgi:NuA3 HAT complex component NTO1